MVEHRLPVAGYYRPPFHQNY